MNTGDRTKEQILNMTEEECHNWIFEMKPNSNEFIRRRNKVYYDYGLSIAGVILKSTRSGELTLDEI